MDEHVLDETHEPEAPVTLEPGDVPPERRHEFRFDPVLAMFDGPWIEVRGSGDHGFAARTFTEVASGTATAESVVGDGRIGADIGAVLTRVYQCSRPVEVWAAVHFVAPDGVVTAWPPVPITFDEAIALTPETGESLAVDGSAIGN